MSADHATGPSTWLFGPPETPVVVHNAEALMAELAVHLGGWPIRWAGATPPRDPDITVAAGAAPGSFRLAAPAIGIA
ncbi:MAG: hypothetical protein FJX67_18945, partial [Alphaproteobacteria bacterium]|nr:hypothetical protein [Alphaproteobacteria bacterium]